MLQRLQWAPDLRGPSVRDEDRPDIQAHLVGDGVILSRFEIHQGVRAVSVDMCIHRVLSHSREGGGTTLPS